MDKLNVRSNWNRMAREYETFTSSKDSYSNLIEWNAIKSILPDLLNKTILDLGCGTGRFCFLFEELNPRKIIGMDLSESMIEIARKNAEDRKSNVQFMLNDIENLSNVDSNSIDLVFSSTTLHYLHDLNHIMSEISRVLVVGGTSILSVIHPVYSAQYPLMNTTESFPKEEEWDIRYLDKSVRAYVQPWIEYNPNVEKFLSYSYHHTMSDYINSIINAGLYIKELLEPLPPKKWEDEKPGRYYSYIKTPTYAIFKVENGFR